MSLWVACGVTMAYLCLYTAFNKQTRALDAEQLLDVLLARRGVDYSCAEWNKVPRKRGGSSMPLAPSRARYRSSASRA